MSTNSGAPLWQVSNPDVPVQQVGETAANFLYRQQQYAYSQGAGPSGPNPGMAQQWKDAFLNQPAPSGFQIL